MSRNDLWQQNDPWCKNEDDSIYTQEELLRGVDESEESDEHSDGLENSQEPEELNEFKESHEFKESRDINSLQQILSEKEEELILMKFIAAKQTELAQKQDTLIENQARYIAILQKELRRQKRDVKDLFTGNQKLQEKLDITTMELNALTTITENGDNESEN